MASRFPTFRRELRETVGSIINVSIAELGKTHERNVIVVDGVNFYGQYLYPKFDWICGSVRELVEELRTFVEAFKRVGVKLVFFFVEGHLDDGYDSRGSETWLERHSDFVRYTNKVVYALSQKKRNLDDIIRERKYYNTPLDVQSVVIFTLRHILHCDVHLTYTGDRSDATAYFTRRNNCLGLLAQDYVYLFYRGILCHLSLYHLTLNDMCTIQYCPEIFAKQKDIENVFYPMYMEMVETLTSGEIGLLIYISKKVEECGNVAISRAKICEYLRGKKIQEVFNVECEDFEESDNDLCKQFVREILGFKLEFEYLTVQGPLEKWELIKLRAQELYTSGQLSNTIQYILRSKLFHNTCILEDFDELPPSSLMYQPLRSKLYGILFHEEPEFDSENIALHENCLHDSLDLADDILPPGALSIRSRKLYGVRPIKKPHGSKNILEWCMSQRGCSHAPMEVMPHLVDPALHPGLLTLWNLNNESSDILDIKWKLFASSVSNRLNIEFLRSLPPTLVVPAAVLCYMFHDVRDVFKTEKRKFLEPWEVEVFIAQAVMLPETSVTLISQINIRNINVRVVKLIASFVYGVHTLHLLVQACGCPISNYDISLSHFFDGKLFHSFYEKAEWRRSAAHLCSRENVAVFQKMKEIVLSDSNTNSRRM